uniref:EF-hand domain-containing protein n=1 Tax=Callorhinchus milii TaxID=7868 RepID=A0A4W3H519_CALMI
MGSSLNITLPFFAPEALNQVQHAVYRTALKLREVQKLCQLHLVDLSLIGDILKRRWPQLEANGMCSVQELADMLKLLFNAARREEPGQVESVGPQLTLNLLLNMFDRNRTGSIQFRSVAAALVTLSADKLSTKYRGENHLTSL